MSAEKKPKKPRRVLPAVEPWARACTHKRLASALRRKPENICSV